jgi:flavorubredoxin
MLPTVGAFLTYLKGLCPKDRIGFVFGSYGWGGQAVKEIEKVLKEMQWHLPLPRLNLQYIPKEDELLEAEAQSRKLAEILREV